MTDFILEFFNDPVHYTVYTSLLIAVTGKYFWLINIDYLFLTAKKKQRIFGVHAENFMLHVKEPERMNDKLRCIFLFIRRKESAGDDPDSLFPFSAH